MTTDHAQAAAAFTAYMAANGDRHEHDRIAALRLEQAEDRATRFANLTAALAILRHDPEMPERLRDRMAELTAHRIDADALDLATRLAAAEQQLAELGARYTELEQALGLADVDPDEAGVPL